MSNWVFAVVLILYGVINLVGAVASGGHERRWPVFGGVFGLVLGVIFVYLALNGGSSHAAATPTPLKVVQAAFTATIQPSDTPVFTETVQPSPTVQPKAIVQRVGVNVRAGPGVNYDVVTGVFQNDELIVLGKSTDGAWIKIITPKGIRGWVFGDLVALADPSQALPVASIDATPTPGPPATQVP